jgi:hypothetical protein
MTVQLGGPLEVVDTLAGPTLRDNHQGEVRTPVQPSREVPATTAGERGSQKQIEEACSQKNHGNWDNQL